jgi:enterochelin esterase-like enzyme
MRVARFLLSFLVFITLGLAQKPAVEDLSKLAKSPGPEFQAALIAAFGDEALGKGTAVLGNGPNFIWAVRSSTPPQLIVDDELAGVLTRIPGTDMWFRTAQLRTSTTHNFHYIVGGKAFGGKNDVIAYGPYAYERAGVPQGKLSEKLIHTSKIYNGMKSDYWIYVPAQYDAKTPAALMVWQDGESLINRELPSRAQIVWDNLTAEKKIPVMIHVLISPGIADGKRMRSIEYDTVDDTYARFLKDEILAEVGAKYNIRKDAYSRAIGGDSSGGICAFNVAWQQPEQFSRVLSRVGSFTSIQWHPGTLDGGNVYPFKVRKEPKRNIRVWLQDGANDLENEHGSWPYTNLALANSLKLREYDFHLSWGNGFHGRNGGYAEMAEELIWLWRDYDAGLTKQTYAIDAAEAQKPFYRVKALNRE